jgi:hypothetical protein
MTQISRPFQIALAVLALFVGVWFLALRGHSSSGTPAVASAPAVATPSTPSPSPSATTSAPAKSAPAHKAHAHQAAAPTPGSLKRTIDKARGAVRHSQHAHGTAVKSSAKTAATPRSATTSKSAATKSAAKPNSTATPKPATTQRSATKPGAAATPKPAKPRTTASGSASAPANTQKAVEAELTQGKVVAVLFWNQKGTVDGVVRHELQAVSHSSHGSVVVHVARANEIGAFGSFTRAVQVYSTPTILLINKSGKTSSLSGLADAFGIEQAVREVKRAK